ncbi:hypothetical protein L0B53_09710 [Vibrio sp. SS-MA-C1-2]|uniref:hypothetical protein n=1 Tax=Vibrio sp. SS-MA-C1-2 TaxID=2908646 RepID=UPI001F475B61|nr:hypothetical protein [Vibrio sp. SS-MA-C1-2]UJF19746.1 hypothetical protein L0B53_09710 [Vibrio sp. SS-MA-C1-2]
MNKLLKSLLLFIAVSSPFAYAAQPIEFQKIPQVMNMFENNAQLYVKKSVTLGRLPTKDEMGKEFITYVSNGEGGYKEETKNMMTDNVVIASMPKPIVGDVYNQWLIKNDIWQELYGKLPTSTTEFKPFKRTKAIKAVKIDKELLTLLGSTDGKTATIKIGWDVNGMKVYLNGYLADYEYGIAPQEMKDNYELKK